CRASKPCRWRSCSGSTWTRTIPATHWNRRVSRRQRRSSPTPSGASPRRCGRGLLRKRRKEEGRRSATSGLTSLLPSTRSSELVGETDRDHGIGFEVAQLRLQVFFFRPQVGLELSRRRRVLGDRAVGEEAHGRRTLQHHAE